MPSCENLNESQSTDQHDRRLQQSQRAEKEDIESGDVDDDRAEDQEAEIARLRDSDTDSAEDFQNFDKGQEAAEEHSSHEHRCGRPFGRLGYGDELQKEIQPEYDKNEAQKAGSEVVDVFHGFAWNLVEIKKEGIGPRVGGQCQNAGFFRGCGIP
jgi:hypothetical protein